MLVKGDLDLAGDRTCESEKERERSFGSAISDKRVRKLEAISAKYRRSF